MTRILVTGGSGVLGRDVVRQLLAAGNEMRVLSRRARRADDPPAAEWTVGDLGTGAGLDGALRGAHVVVHCASNPRRPRQDLAAARNLIAAARRAGSPHLIYVSIAGVDRVPYGYYQIKLEVERLIEQSGLPWTVLRATQFHDLLCYIFQWATRLPVLVLPAGVSFQPADTGDVAFRLAMLTTGEPAGHADDLGGPLVQPVGELARAWLQAVSLRRPLVPVRSAPSPPRSEDCSVPCATNAPGWCSAWSTRAGLPWASATIPSSRPGTAC
jgi:uncharacterized protein YbjT (DUF2867 family)